MNNLYLPGSIGINPRADRIIQDLFERVNYLTEENQRMKTLIENSLKVKARKERPVQGVLILPSPNGDGFIRINEDGVIVSYTSPASMVGVSVTLKVDSTKVDSSGVGPDVLHTYTLPANSLRSDNDYVDVWYSGNFAANDRDKSVQGQFDGQSYEAPGVTDIDLSIGWILGARIARLSSTSVRVSNFSLENAVGVDSAGGATSYGTGGNMFIRNQDLTSISNMNSSDIVMRVRSVVAAGAAAADVYQTQSIIKLTRMS